MEAAVIKHMNSNVAGITPDEVFQQVQAIQQLMERSMKDNEHYGVIPGTNKPTLLKAGAEKLSLMFRLAPSYKIDKDDMGNGHREYEVSCTLTHIQTGNVWGEGVGICSTMESKFRYRKASRVCPECSTEAIVKGKAEYGGGWLCFKKQGGCGAKFSDGDQVIESQPQGRVENEDIADVYNTVKKMAKKRAYIDAMLTATAASDIFTQDLEEIKENEAISNPSPIVVQPEPIQPEAPKVRNYTHEASQCKTIDELKVWWKSLSADEKKKYDALKNDRKAEIDKAAEPEIQEAEEVKEDDPLRMINNLKGAATNEYLAKLDAAIDGIQDGKERLLYLEKYKTKLERLGINHKPEVLPF